MTWVRQAADAIGRAAFAARAWVLAGLMVAGGAPVQAQPVEGSNAPTSAVNASVSRAKRAGGVSGSRRTKVKWKMGVSGQSFANEKETAESAGVNLGGDIRHRLMQTLEIKTEATVDLQSGHAQSRFGDNAPASGVYLKEATVRWRPFPSLSFQGGAINQAHLLSPLLVSARPFPGVLEKITIGDDDLSFEVKAEQTIPTSVALSTRTVDREPTPSFLTETATLRVRFFEVWSNEVYGTHFRYKDLPSAVAMDSGLHGNTILEQGPNTSAFQFPFEGLVFGGASRVQVIPGLKLGAGGQWLRNSGAPVGYREGQLAFVDAEIGVAREIALAPKAEVFFNESDSSPAFYNSSVHGHNNRKGYGAGLDVLFKRHGFKVGGSFTDADVINPNLNQSRQQFFSLHIETFYDGI